MTPSIEHDEALEPVPGNGICARLSDKWTIPLLCRLSNAAERRLRFSTLKRELNGVTQRMLTLTLRNLERDGLIERHCFPEVPPRVEYSITARGYGVLDALKGVNAWVRTNMPAIEESRRAFDTNGR